MKATASFAGLLEGFFANRLVRQKRASPHTIAGYRDTFRLLLKFAHQRLGKAPSNLNLTDLDAAFIGAFLQHLEQDRRNGARTRNARLAGIRSFFRYVAFEAPQHSALIQRVLAMPQKRCEKRPIDFLSRGEFEALVAAPDLHTWAGRRDRALLLLAVQTGLRVSELIGLNNDDLVLDHGACYVRCQGKGRKQRLTPLRQQTVTALRTWSQERGGRPSDPLFPNARGGRLSRDGLLIWRHLERGAHLQE